MENAFDRPDRRGLTVNVAAALAVVLVCNALIFGLNWSRPSPRQPAFVPSSVEIGAIWVALFVTMATARWELNRVPTTLLEKRTLVVLLASCALYPLYTLGLSSDLIGEAANVALLILAIGLVTRCVRKAPRAAAWLVPLCIWLAFASVAGAFVLRE